MQGDLFAHEKPEPDSKLVVQRNDLVNARFALTTLEMRLFMAMLSRIEREDTEFHELHIPVTEVVAVSGRRPSSNDYQQLKDMCALLASRVLYIERPSKKKSKRAGQGIEEAPSFSNTPLMAYADYNSEERALVVRFNDRVREHLLQLNEGNFTQAQLMQLLKLKSAHSYRIYWLLKQYGSFGTRTIRVDELKRVLDLEGQYKQFPLFKLRVLDRAQQELAQTNLAFQYDLIRGKSNSVEEIRFRFEPVTNEVLLPSLPATTEWQKVLLEVGVSASSIAAVGELIDKGDIEPGYVQYVVHQQRSKSSQGKIKSLAGAVFTSITKGHLVEDYHKMVQQRQKTSGRKPASSSHQLIRIRLQEAREAFEVMQHKKTAKGTTFEENLELVYLSQGFRQEKDAQGIEWLIKEA
ncbi:MULTISPECIES: replication initiation protein [Hymenobacter]|uniref:Initiator Replication protein n=1 Tax=Hymenobacter mucosus TaxID=1411120 RepID=A0A239AN31_9BACT|nr:MULTISPECIES: replication initiation protein [Hymenobacter]SNR96398.1 Initiator Replication protein [Hymenobacter mucosus]